MKQSEKNIYSESTEFIVTETYLNSFSIHDIISSMNRITNKFEFDGYTLNGIQDFVIYGFTENRVKSAPNINEPDKLFLVSYDYEYNYCIGLCIIFNNKFYSLPFSKGRRSQDELYEIIKNRKRI